MNWFVYGYSKQKGHGFHTPVDQQFERETYGILHQGIYGDIPNDTAFVGHFRARKRWLILVKRVGEGDVLGRLLTEEQYRRYGFSPYRLVYEEIADAPVTNIGSPLSIVGLTFPIAIAQGNDYIDVCARLFEDFSEDRRLVPHRSVSSKAATEAQAFFRLDENAGRGALDRLVGDGTTGAGGHRRAPESYESARLNRLESRIVELERQEVALLSPLGGGSDFKQIEGRVARLEDLPRALASVRTALARVEDRIDTVEPKRREIPPPTSTDTSPEIEQIESRVAQLEDLPRDIASVQTALARVEGRFDTPRERSAGKPLTGEAEPFGQQGKKPVWRRLETMTAAAVVLALGVLVAFIYPSLKDEVEALRDDSQKENAAFRTNLEDLTTKFADETAGRNEKIEALKKSSRNEDAALRSILEDLTTKLADETAGRNEEIEALKESSQKEDAAFREDLKELTTKLADETSRRQVEIQDLRKLINALDLLAPNSGNETRGLTEPDTGFQTRALSADDPQEASFPSETSAGGSKGGK